MGYSIDKELYHNLSAQFICHYFESDCTDVCADPSKLQIGYIVAYFFPKQRRRRRRT